jgi:hypothetical protein
MDSSSGTATPADYVADRRGSVATGMGPNPARTHPGARSIDPLVQRIVGRRGSGPIMPVSRSVDAELGGHFVALDADAVTQHRRWDSMVPPACCSPWTPVRRARASPRQLRDPVCDRVDGRFGCRGRRPGAGRTRRPTRRVGDRRAGFTGSWHRAARRRTPTRRLVGRDQPGQAAAGGSRDQGARGRGGGQRLRPQRLVIRLHRHPDRPESAVGRDQRGRAHRWWARSTMR